MKKRKFNTGGKFELDADALASGLRIGKNERISDADRNAALGNEDSKLRAKMQSEKYNSPSVVDQYRDFGTHPEAKAFPIAAQRQLDTVVEGMPETSESKQKPSDSKDRLGKMVEKLGGSRVGFTVPDLSNRKGGIIKKMAKGGKVGNRADGIAQRGKTKGRFV
jgi:hypothetical protein